MTARIQFVFKLLKRVGFAVMLLGTCLTTQAQWPVELRWSGVSLGYPKIGADGENGVFVAGSGLAFNGWDTFLLHVDSAGNSLWEVSDSACYIAPGNQYPIALYPDGTGGCVALIDEEVLNFPNPSRNRVQIIRYNAEGHKVWQYMPYDTTLEDLHSFGALAVTHGQVFIYWYSIVSDSVGDWHTRLRVSDGVALDTPATRLVSTRGIRQIIEKNDNLFLLAADSVLVHNPENGGIAPFLYWGRLYTPQMLLRGDSTLIAGRVSGNGLSPWVLRCLHGDTVRNDTIGQGIVAINMVSFGEQIVFGYARSGDLFCRFFTPEIGLGPELAICDAEDDQYGLITTRGTDGLGFVWQDRLPSAQPRLHIQQWEDGAFRWPQGYLLADSVDQHAVCYGSRFGYVASAFTGYYFRIQPIDSLVTVNAAEYSDVLPERFTLHNPSPNPFNGSVEISFDVLRTSHASLTVYDLLGREQVTLVDDVVLSGTTTVRWDAGGFASGIYFVRLVAGEEMVTRKVVLLK